MAITKESVSDAPSRVIVDTAPTAQKSSDPAPDHESLDPNAFADEPWPDADPDGEPVDASGGASLVLEDVSSFERWLQSGLRALVEPEMGVDGVLGRKTEAAIRKFQKQGRRFGVGPLTVDGKAGPKTIAALERATQSTRTSIREEDRITVVDDNFVCWLQRCLKALVAPKLTIDGDEGPETEKAVERFQQRAADFGVGPLKVDGKAGPKTIAALETATGTTSPRLHGEPPGGVAGPGPNTATHSALVVTETQKADGTTAYTVRAGGDWVRFSYWPNPHQDASRSYCVSRYEGARTGLVTNTQILSAGYSSSELKILRTNALEESGGTFGAINTWDDQLVSWGMAQFAGQAGTLAALLAELKRAPDSRASFVRWFADNGIDVACGDYPWKQGQTKTGLHVVVKTVDGRTLLGNPGWEYIRTQPRLLGAFMLAGTDPAIQFGQIKFWRRAFLLRAIAKRIGRAPDGSGGDAVRRYVTSERGIAAVVRLYNWMPAYVVEWSDQFIAELQKKYTSRKLRSPADWNQAVEDDFVEMLCARRKQVKKGSYDEYIKKFRGKRGTFDASTS